MFAISQVKSNFVNKKLPIKLMNYIFICDPNLKFCYAIFSLGNSVWKNSFSNKWAIVYRNSINK